MSGLVLVARASRDGAPRLDDDLAAALAASGLEGADRIALAVPRVASDVDRDAAFEKARDAAGANVERLEAEGFARGARVVAFVGLALYAAALGARLEAEDADEGARDRFERTFRARARFGGAVAVAIPSPSRQIPIERVVARVRDLARLCAEAAA